MKTYKLLFFFLLVSSSVTAQGKTTSDTLKYWLSTNFNIEIPAELEFVCQFDIQNYQGVLSEEVKNEFDAEQWLQNVLVSESVYDSSGILLDLEMDYFSKTIALTKDYFTVSFHGMIGSDGQTLIYSFKEKELYLDNEIYVMEIISPTILIVGKDYYDSRDNEDPDYVGHIFEYGSYDLTTKEYIFLGYE